MDLADGEFQHETDGLLLAVPVLLDDLIQQALGLGSVASLLDAGVAADLGILIDHAQTDDLVAIVDQFVDQPFEGKLGVIVLVGAAQEGP